MGSCTVKSKSGKGVYQVELNLDVDRRANTIAALATKIAEMEDKLLLMEPGRAASLLALQIVALEQKKQMLESLPSSPEITASCADYSIRLSGAVGTLEVPGERGAVNVMPGGDAGIGQLQPAGASTPAGVFYNWALLAARQRWKPTYRYGTISNIDLENDTGDVALEAATSSVQGLTINQETSLTAVPIVYMSCHADAFTDGDEVIVSFGYDWDTPTIIGFKENPKQCLKCPDCDEFANEDEWCFMEADTEYTLKFDSIKESNCETWLEALSDGLDAEYTGTFDNARYDEEEEQWLVDYTTHEDMCDAGENPVICAHEYPSCFTYSDENAETIGKSSNTVITITGGKSPFQWGVSGTDVSLAFSETANRTNTLYTGSTTCGAIDITVTDACNEQITGTVRCTDGQWVFQADGCGVEDVTVGPYKTTPTGWDGEYIGGGRKQIQYTEDTNLHNEAYIGIQDGNCDHRLGDALARCFWTQSPYYCHGTWGCTSCVTHTKHCPDGTEPWGEGPIYTMDHALLYLWCYAHYQPKCWVHCNTALRYYDWEC